MNNYKIAPLFITPGIRAATTSEVYMAQPDLQKEALAGRLFIIVEIENKNPENLKIINFIINSLSFNYYQSDKLVLRERLASLKVEHIFETALAKTNKELSDFLKNSRLRLDFHYVNFTAGMIYGDEVHFTNVGKNKIYLLYKDQKSTENKYKITEIGQAEKAYEAELENGKLFTHVLSGNLPANGYMVFCNETLPEYMSRKQLSDIITTLPPTSAVEQIKNILESINSYVTFLGVIIKSNILSVEEVRPEDVERELLAQTTTSRSISALNTTEQITEKLLMPSGLINIKHWKDNLKGFIPGIFKGNKTQAIVIKDRIILKKRYTFVWFRQLATFIGYLLIIISKLFNYFVQTITKPGELRKLPQKTVFLIKSIAISAIAWFRSLGTASKAALLILILITSIFFFNLNKTKKENIQIQTNNSYNTLLEEIAKKQYQIESSLLYNNQGKTQELYNELLTLIGQIPQDKPETVQKYNELRQKIDAELDKLRKISAVTPQEIADYSNINNPAEPSGLIFDPSTNRLFASDSRNKAIYVTDFNTNLTTQIRLADKDLQSIGFPIITKAGNVVFFDRSNVIYLDKKADTANLVAYPDLATSTVDIAYFNTSLYILADNTIWKASQKDNTFTKPVKWLNGNVFLPDNTRSLSIDGNIYTINNSGQTGRYLKGEARTLVLDKIEPALSFSDKMIASEDSDNIFVLDSQNSRIALFQKNGAYIRQFKFKDLSVRNFTISEKTKTIFLLTEKSAYKFGY